ncbi:MAG: peptide chain release factor N(5)-glutamine methyltransferase [Actinobacteria bacterium]|nr:peptide chain release factor N(5)-glutamine methyltransferase [Actinomycetota bacterium]
MDPLIAVKEGCAFLKDTEVASPEHDAEALLEFVLGVPRVQFYAGEKLELTEKELFTYRLMLARRAEGYPLQYMIGTTGFRGIELSVKPGVFIPRPETEILVEKAIEILPTGHAEVLDLCCGCGNICISIAKEHAAAKVTAVDKSRESVRLCSANARENDVFDDIEIREGDLFDALPENMKFDAIVSNPPYVPISIWGSLPREVRDHEPHTALVAGIDGLEFIRRIIFTSPFHLKEGGWLVLEAGEDQIKRIESELSTATRSSVVLSTDSIAGGMVAPIHLANQGDPVPVWSDIESFGDLAGKPRIVRAMLSCSVGAEQVKCSG